MINPVQSEEILTLNSKVLLRLQEALIYVGTPPSTLIIPMQVQAQIPHPPAVAAYWIQSLFLTHTRTQTQTKENNN